MQSEYMIANGVPVLRYAQSEEFPGLGPSQKITDPPRTQTARPRKKRRKTVAPQQQNSLLYYMNNNINTLRRVRSTHARLTVIKDSNGAEDTSAQSAPALLGLTPQASLVLPPTDEPESVVDDRPWRVGGSGIEVGEKNADECLHWMGSKVLEHAGFQGVLFRKNHFVSAS